MTAKRLTALSRSVTGYGVVITGAASGMGRATAHLFADEGARVVVVDLGEDRVGEVVAEIAAVHGPDRVLGVAGDVTQPDTPRRVVAETLEAFGSLDALVNNAGVSLPARLDAPEDEFMEVWNRTLEVNLTAQMRMMRACLDALSMAVHGGRVVNIASTESVVATSSLSAYAASKAAVTGMTRAAAIELGPRDITVNAICPGPIDTAMTAAIPPEAKARYAQRRVALRRYGDPEEVAHMTLNLCLPASRFVTGATICVDGGLTIRHT